MGADDHLRLEVPAQPGLYCRQFHGPLDFGKVKEIDGIIVLVVVHF